MPRRVVLIGANGQLGSEIRAAAADRATLDLVPLTHVEIEVCDLLQARETLTRLEPDVVINTAAFHRVDDCENEVARTFAVNATAVRHLAEVCRDLDALLVHLSTDYVFGGDTSRRRPYTESAPPAPLNAYGVSKLAGELLLAQCWERHLIIRTSGLYGVAGASGKGGNFVELMLRLAREGKPIRVVDDQRLSPTPAADCATTLLDLVEAGCVGLYHVATQGDCSWFEFAQAIFEHEGLSPHLEPTTTAAFGARACRPAYSALASERLTSSEGSPSLHWQEALEDYFERRT